MENLTKEYYTTGEIAKLCGLSYQAVSRWLTQGIVIPREEVRRTSPTGNYRVTRAGVAALQESQNAPAQSSSSTNPAGRSCSLH